MEQKGVKRLPTTEVKAHFGQIVHEVATTGTPVVRALSLPWDKTPEREDEGSSASSLSAC